MLLEATQVIAGSPLPGTGVSLREPPECLVFLAHPCSAIFSFFLVREGEGRRAGRGGGGGRKISPYRKAQSIKDSGVVGKEGGIGGWKPFLIQRQSQTFSLISWGKESLSVLCLETPNFQSK